MGGGGGVICLYSLCYTFYSPISVLCRVITSMNTEFSCGCDITGSWNCCGYVVSAIFARSGGLYGGWISAHSAENFSKLYMPGWVPGRLLSERRQDAIGYRRRVLRINRRKPHGTYLVKPQTDQQGDRNSRRNWPLQSQIKYSLLSQRSTYVLHRVHVTTIYFGVTIVPQEKSF
jgi:hypothetical protein